MEEVMKTLDAQWLAAKREYIAAVETRGPRSIYAALAHAKLKQLTARILRRDSRRRAA
jgi:hypothetical protein